MLDSPAGRLTSAMFLSGSTPRRLGCDASAMLRLSSYPSSSGEAENPKTSLSAGKEASIKEEVVEDVITEEEAETTRSADQKRAPAQTTAKSKSASSRQEFRENAPERLTRLRQTRKSSLTYSLSEGEAPRET